MKDITFEAQPSQEQTVRALLKETNTVAPPTDAEAFARYFNLNIDYFDPTHNDYNLNNKKVIAFLWLDEDLIGISSLLSDVQRRFSILHEVGHFVLHAHTDIEVDSEGRISDTSKNMSLREKSDVVGREIEANQFAADCLFQLERFDNLVHTKTLSWVNILQAADQYIASIEATARRWVEKSSEACALVAFNPIDRFQLGSELEIIYTITSPLFEKTYFSKLEAGQKLSNDSVVYKYFHGLDYFGNTPEDVLRVRDTGDEITEFRMRLFSNSYRVFGLLTPIDA